MCSECPVFVQRMGWKVWWWDHRAFVFALRTLPSIMRRMSSICVENGFLCAVNKSASFSEHCILFCVFVCISFQVLSSF